MNQRIYNVYFHLHTVSGIVISVGLFVIFFAGAFALFYGPTERWEKGEKEAIAAYRTTPPPTDYNRLVDSLLARKYPLYGRSLYTSEEGKFLQRIDIYDDRDIPEEKKAQPIHLQLDTRTYQLRSNQEEAEGLTLASLLYQLHFFYQLGDFGYYLAGLVALFFLFATVTGVVVHWKKITLNFYVFRPKQKLKTVWTDAHTFLGVIGIPFQFMYALTGAMFCLGIAVTLSGSLMYGGSTKKVEQVLYEEGKKPLGKPADVSRYDYNTFRKRVDGRWEGFKGQYFSITQFGSTTQRFSGGGHVALKDEFLNNAEVEFDMASGRVVHEHNPRNKAYEDYVWSSVGALHFARFNGISPLGDYALRMLYFLLALLTCFVIVSGVLIWLEARRKKAIPEKQRRFNEEVGHVYLAICLSMLPVTAFAFVVTRLLPAAWVHHQNVILNSVYFGSWLLVSVFFWLKRNNAFTNRYTLLSAGILGIGIPFVNGASSGSWFWKTFAARNYDVFLIDALWAFLALSCFYALARMRREPRPVQTTSVRQAPAVSRSAKPVPVRPQPTTVLTNGRASES